MLEMCERPVTTTPPPSHVFEEWAQGKRWNSMDFLTSGGPYTSGQECCNACVAQDSNYKWVSVGVAGTDKAGQCACKSNPNNPSPTNKPNLKNTDGTNWIRGTCLLSGKRKKREAEQYLMSTNELSLKRYEREASNVETQDEIDRRSYGSRLRYECGKARRFYDPEAEEFYDERTIQCNWNNTWSRHDYIDECVWTQCLYPPPSPEGYLLTTTWSGDPVEFYDNATYVCDGEELYFEWDRDMAEFNVTCLPGGAWELPDEWPRCVACQ